MRLTYVSKRLPRWTLTSCCFFIRYYGLLLLAGLGSKRPATATERPGKHIPQKVPRISRGSLRRSLLALFWLAPPKPSLCPLCRSRVRTAALPCFCSRPRWTSAHPHYLSPQTQRAHPRCYCTGSRVMGCPLWNINESIIVGNCHFKRQPVSW